MFAAPVLRGIQPHAQALAECKSQRLPAYIQLKGNAVNSGAQEPMYVQLSAAFSGLPSTLTEEPRRAVAAPAPPAFGLQPLPPSGLQPVMSRPVAREDLRLAMRKSATGHSYPAEFLVTQNTKRGHGAKLHIKHPGCVIYVSNMARLGSDSVSALRGHFEQYGEIVDLWLSVADVNSRLTADQKLQRPCGIALLILRSKDDANMAIAAGEHQIVSGLGIHVRAFNPRTDHPRHQKDWYISEKEVLSMQQSLKIDDESDTCSIGQLSLGSDSTAEPGTPTGLKTSSWSY